MRQLNFIVSGPKFTYFLTNAGELRLIKFVSDLSISRFVPEIFAIEV